jgi:N-acetylmuramoyl-L-alanine amidase
MGSKTAKKLCSQFLIERHITEVEVIFLIKIFIDPGHGGSDPGAVGNGIQEKEITWNIAERIQEILISEYEDVLVKMSRTGDQTVSLTARTNAADSWGADYYLSIHINSGGGTGFESFIYPGAGQTTLKYQKYIHEQVLRQSHLRDRGLKQANFHVLRESNMPAILTENGFIDHKNDAAMLKNISFINSLARGHVNGIAEVFCLSKKLPKHSMQSSQSLKSALFRVQIGAFKDRNHAERQKNEAKAKGFTTYMNQMNGLFKVQIGAFAVRRNAEELLKTAKQAGFEAVIVMD